MTPMTLSNGAPQCVHAPVESWSSCSIRSSPPIYSEIVLGVKAARDRCEVVKAIRGHHPRVLDTHPAKPNLVETGLYRDHIAFAQRSIRGLTQRWLLVNIESNPVTSVVVHLRDSVGSLETGRRRPVAAIDEHLADGEVDVLREGAGSDRFNSGVERLQRRRVHAPKFLGDIADHDSSREVAVVVAAPSDWKNVDDHGCGRTDRSFASVLR